jgi:hypothetical protein
MLLVSQLTGEKKTLSLPPFPISDSKGHSEGGDNHWDMERPSTHVQELNLQ